mmetsp:Transcript_2983/g.8147  ORF Transcript_2983/g.8147 Transcript_2983/m.8147 type:complete len:81 (+) Transcript_2983:1000-1242(+)
MHLFTYIQLNSIVHFSSSVDKYNIAFSLHGNNLVILPEEEHTQQHQRQPGNNQQIQKISDTDKSHDGNEQIARRSAPGTH